MVVLDGVWQAPEEKGYCALCKLPADLLAGVGNPGLMKGFGALKHKGKTYCCTCHSTIKQRPLCTDPCNELDIDHQRKLHVDMLLAKADLFEFTYTPLEQVAAREAARLQNVPEKTCKQVADLLRVKANAISQSMLSF